MDLNKKLEEAVDNHERIVKLLQENEAEKNRLLTEGVKLEGRIGLIKEQLAEEANNEKLQA